MKIIKCPFCQTTLPKHLSIVRTERISFNSSYDMFTTTDAEYQLDILIVNCPNCGQVSFSAEYKGDKMPQNTVIPIYPANITKEFPAYIPQTILQDYKEAASIINLSPKASATLSRRCIQGMIRDFWNIKDSTLFKEIDALKSKVSSSEFEAINALRQLGNIGAHMEKDTNLIIDIEPNEAQKLLKLIEYLLNAWYIKKHEQEELLKSIIDINAEKQNARKNQ